MLKNYQNFKWRKNGFKQISNFLQILQKDIGLRHFCIWTYLAPWLRKHAATRTWFRLQASWSGALPLSFTWNINRNFLTQWRMQNFPHGGGAANPWDWLLPAATKLGQGNIFTGVCLSTGGGEGCLPQCMLGYTPLDQAEPPDQADPPGPSRPLRTRQTPPDQADPPRPGRPPRADNPLGADTPPGSRLQHTVNEQPVGFLSWRSGHQPLRLIIWQDFH